MLTMKIITLYHCHQVFQTLVSNGNKSAVFQQASISENLTSLGLGGRTVTCPSAALIAGYACSSLKYLFLCQVKGYTKEKGKTDNLTEKFNSEVNAEYTF